MKVKLTFAMAFLGKGKKCDLTILAQEMGITVPSDARVFQIKDLITKSDNFDESYVRDYLTTIIEERLATEKEQQNEFELEKLRLQIEVQKHLQPSAAAGSDCNLDSAVSKVKMETNIQQMIPRFKDTSDIAGYLQIFERQCETLDVKKQDYITYLLPLLPLDISQIILREPKDKIEDYSYVKKILLERFKLNAEAFRIKLTTHQRQTGMLWKDFAYELSNYLDEWLHGLDVTDFESLKDLVLTDQIKRRVSNDIKDHFVDNWGKIKSSNELVQKLDDYEAVRVKKATYRNPPPVKRNYSCNENNPSRNKVENQPKDPQRLTYQKKFNSHNPKFQGELQYDQQSLSGNPSHSRRDPGVLSHSRRDPIFKDRTPISCYGCGKSGVIRAKCPDCNPPETSSHSLTFGTLQIRSCLSSTRTAVLPIRIGGVSGTAFADSGASHSIASESLYHILQQQGAVFEKKTLQVSFADGFVSEKEVLHTDQNILLEGREFKTPLIVLPDAKNNSTLLGIDFLQKAKIVLNLADNKWNFADEPQRKYSFVTPHQSKEMEETPIVVNKCQLRDNEGQQLTFSQRSETDALLIKYERVFKVGGAATTFIEHHINTGNNPPVSVPPYRMSPTKKELLKQEIDSLLEQGIIEECESPYASPVVLIPKPDGKVRLCIDYRKLNSQTVQDTYPLPRIDDLLNEAKPTPYMSTIDLRSGYHQVKVAKEDQDKTAFICPFGTYKFNRMPFGLRNAPATFSRLIDKFRSGLHDVFALSYLDDIIILSDTFQKHLSDLEQVLQRLLLFNLNANREKCHFCCERVKYLGHYITKDGIAVDPQKTAAIANMPSPKTVKQVQSFVQTCSWYRRYIPNFAQVAKPLTDLTKKKAVWKWEADQENAFQVLKARLISPPILKQADGTKPFVIRTDASDVALGAVLVQGEKEEEHPIEYASRLLSSSERNYSTTEREALAVVWALSKFRGYIEGQSIKIVSDHQPLRWLMSLKSPTGRLARWALQIQSYNLSIDHIPGKSNFIADLLSRPICEHSTTESCEICAVTIAIPTTSPAELRQSQLEDDSLRKIIDTFESPANEVDCATWTGRGYIMNRGVLYRYSPDSEEEEAQLVIPQQRKAEILKEYHDSPMAGHYGSEGTFYRIAKRYYWLGMRKDIADYVKSCPECCRYKASNQKPSGLLQTPAYAQRFETLSIDLFGPLPETPSGEKWIFIVQDCATKWVELFALKEATAMECATTLVEEVALRFGLPRQVISDNGPQFISAVMQQLCFILNIDHNLTPVYHPQSNPVERKNRDLKPRLAILVGNDHRAWRDKLSYIRFALNTARCESTGQSAAFLQFARELRTLDDVKHDIKAVLDNDNFVPEITPYLKRFARTVHQVRERAELHQDKQKRYADKKRQEGPKFKPGDKVWVSLHPVSKGPQFKTSKFMPKRDGPYVIVTTRSPTTFEIANPNDPGKILGKYHISALKPYQERDNHLQQTSERLTPVVPLRKRGRPKRLPTIEPEPRVTPELTSDTRRARVSPPSAQGRQRPGPDSLPGRLRSQRGRM